MKKKQVHRNPFAIPAKSKKSGPMRSKKPKRKKSEIKEIEKEY